MEEEIKMAETVMLIDASFLNFVTEDIKRNFESMLKRKLQDMDLSHLFTYIALDAGISEGKNETQIFFIYDDDSAHLVYAQPSDLTKELNNVAFSNEFGEFCFNTFQPEKMTSREELFLESLNVLADAEEVKRIVVLSFNEEYGEKVHKILKKVKEKELIQFRMNEPDNDTEYRWEMLAYPVMQALGIRGDELH
ncbi:DUF6621 family protein [uncultured Bacteroides sp.]|uniref:DUF6621 family protein n=1 Tax=uncultured Bacteroides sp. TaxID=162156 RepID=UPI002AABDFAD|nr:DUF6621 family protein [uncultured Bacteroides sp.]